jgi:CRP-like cAMP-binding protein
MADLRKLKDKAAELASKGKVEKAAELFREILRADPKDSATCQKLADVLRRGGEIAEAVERYAEVAERFARDGLLIKAIAICKTILELDPEHVVTQRQLADLYSKRNIADAGRAPVRPRPVPAAPPPSAPPPAPEPEPALVEEEGIELAVEPEFDGGVALPLPAANRPAETHASSAIDLPPVSNAPGELFDSSELQAELGGEPDPFAIFGADEPLGAPASTAPQADADGEETSSWLEPTGAQPAAVTPAYAPPPPPPQPARPLSPPPPPPAPHVARPTAFNLIVAAAEQAVEAGVEDQFEVDVDLVDDEVLALTEVEPLPEEAGAVTRADARLPHFPIFSDLGPEAFVALTEALQVTRLAGGETVVTEGDVGTAFFVVATGRLVVKKRDEKGDQVVLAHLGEGEFFGEMSLLSAAPRNATVVAEEPTEVLVLEFEVLRGLAGRYPHLAGSLRRFYRQRLLANALAISALFRPFGREDRKAVMEKFRERTVQAGEVVIREGLPADGLYVVLEGSVDVTRGTEAGDVLVGQLREGDLFGEMSCMRKTGATATVTVKRGGSLLKLQRSDFDALVMTYPTVLELVSMLSEERAQNLDAILSGSAAFTEDGLVLI